MIKGINCNHVLRYNLKYIREQKELTQEEVSRGTGLSLRTYSGIELGEGNPTLESLQILAEYFDVTLSRLFTMSHLKLRFPEAVFIDRVKEKFLNYKGAVVIRDFNGIALWGNLEASKIAGTDMTSNPVNLLSIKSEAARDVIKAQISAERAGIVQPYINTSKFGDRELAYFRVYPAIVMPQKGKKPIFNVSYLVLLEQDTDQKYFNYCLKLSECLGEE